MSSSSVETQLDETLGSRFAEIALGHVTREYPNVIAYEHTFGVKSPKTVHPIFYGSYDWHSCVHSYWLLASLLRLFPTIEQADEISSLFEDSFTDVNIAGELETLEPLAQRGFERPYGWAWALMLQAELKRHETQPWAETVQPLADFLVEQFGGYLPKMTYPIRSGVHSSTAFAIALALEYADASDAEFAKLLRDTAIRWYVNDADYQAWEPSGEDFLSPALSEAECMRRVMEREKFASWLKRFLPRLGQGEPGSLFTPVEVSDRSDGRIVHLDGLNLSRAWCWRALARALPEDDPASAVLIKTAKDHLAASLPYLAGDYMGEHWLASFALLALRE
ncbi:MAG TPA: DUF2891 domain-containing protein [Micropepsaceae bacterium]|nr:DUF2891 domain-containing protein [Micropepsaceae bacterium]